MRPKTKQIIGLQRMVWGDCVHTVTCKRIGSVWHVRVLVDGVVNQETIVYDRMHIGHAARDMLRMEDKCGNISQFASNSRDRKGRKFRAASENL